MNKVAIAFSTKDRVELSRRTVEPLLRPNLFDLFWIDGSNLLSGQTLPAEYSQAMSVRSNVRGGADAAIVYALTAMLANPDYTHIGLVENDVLLDPDWFAPTMALFERGRAEGLEVGAVSARCYEDRILCQRDGYALVHNLGAGMIIFTRQAASLVLAHFRTGWTTENRRIFMALSGLDLGRWWAFRGAEHFTCADWQFDRVLAQHGLASLALTPSPVQMIGQEPPLAEQGLVLATKPVELLRNDAAFNTFCRVSRRIRAGDVSLCSDSLYRAPDGNTLVFPHQIGMLGGFYTGDWRLRWSQGLGPFAWEAGGLDKIGAYPTILTPVSGPCGFLVSGGREGGKVLIHDHMSGYQIEPDLPPEGENQSVLHVMVPATIAHRQVELRALTPGVRFYALQVRDPQMICPTFRFDHSVLPPVA